MNHQTLRERVLSASAPFFPWLLGVAFAFGNIPRFYWVGIGLLLFLAVWYGLWNFRAALSSRWALLVVGFFAAIALKDGILWAAGAGRFDSFAKSGSRIVSLFGAAAMLAAYPRKETERAFGLALGVSAAIIAAEALLVLWGKAGQPVMNSNTFGMLFAWLPLYFALRLREKGKAWAEILAAVVGLAGLGLLYYHGFKLGGDRTAPIAYAVGLVYLYLANPLRSRPSRAPRALLAVEVACAAAAIAFLSLVFVPKIDAILTGRAELWGAYAAKGMERPLLGWGYTDEGDNIRLVADKLRGMPIHDQFMASGLGPHNSLLAMFFENGALFALAYLALLFLRARKTGPRAGLFDVSLAAYIAFMSADAMAPGGVTFLGFYLGACLLSPILNETESA
jgi:hypothetical protein